ncbi:MAG TPA: tRNA (adenosine(37)-N6)-threonylcarbamoyltransferase complex dimerization subunit type 1 TsaB [Longimicrobiales bacterium]|nr:tRNA (adenosine(37)-N6)-threonylcarbamoyltransferase complex dimerization subunit type 1 TsaB [Longimicrobiales bacterium]
MSGRDGVLVALETSGPTGSVALARGGEPLGQLFLRGDSAHAARLVPALSQLLAEAGVERWELSGVVVGGGPGSFTGVRVAAATAKGLVHAMGVPLRAISSLEAGAVADRVPAPVAGGPWDVPEGLTEGLHDPTREETRWILFDARGDRVYAACYRVRPDGIEVLHRPRADRVGRLLAEPRRAGLHYAGSGAIRHRATIEAAGGRVLPPPAGMPTAAGLLHVLALRGGVDPVEDPWAWEPDYLRASGAERKRKG